MGRKVVPAAFQWSTTDEQRAAADDGHCVTMTEKICSCGLVFTQTLSGAGKTTTAEPSKRIIRRIALHSVVMIIANVRAHGHGREGWRSECGGRPKQPDVRFGSEKAKFVESKSVCLTPSETFMMRSRAGHAVLDTGSMLLAFVALVTGVCGQQPGDSAVGPTLTFVPASG
ncbi:hypothetical protein BaRGS_00021581, partial [Batillaria attramentaria]